MLRFRFTVRGLMAAVALAALVFGAIAFLMRLDTEVILPFTLLAWPLTGLGLVFAINARTNPTRDE